MELCNCFIDFSYLYCDLGQKELLSRVDKMALGVIIFPKYSPMPVTILLLMLNILSYQLYFTNSYMKCF